MLDDLERVVSDGHGPLWSHPVLLTVRGLAWLNSNDRLNRFDQARRVKVWRENAYAAARHAPWVAEVAAPWERIHVVAFLMFSNRQRRDPGNWYPTVKACVDGLVDAKLIVDDSTKHVVGPDLRAHPWVLAVEPTVQLLIYRVPGTEDFWEPRATFG
jgi:hypothetical protein